MPIVRAGDRSFDVDAVVFDKDGTLLDLDGKWFPAAVAWIDAVAATDGDVTAALADRLGVDLAGGRLAPDGIVAAGTLEQIRAATADVALARSWSRPDIDDALRRAQSALEQVLAATAPTVLGDLPELFTALAAAGLKVAVLTSDEREPTLGFLRAVAAHHLVDLVVTATDVEHPKPHPFGLHHISARLSVATHRMLMIGDSSHDREAARAAGVAFVAVGHRSGAAPGADAIIAGVDELTVPPAAVGDPIADSLNSVGVLSRREIEARIVAPLLSRLAERYDDGVYAIAREVIADVARQQGAALAAQLGDDSLPAFARGLGAWSADGALESQVIELTETSFAFDVTRCRYAEMYRALGLEELGATLSCNRDGSLIEGFNPNVVFTRTQTIMGGAGHCDFRFRVAETTVDVTR